MGGEEANPENYESCKTLEPSLRPPTPPPLPDLSESSKTKESPFVLKLRSAPPGWFYQSPDPEPPRDPFASPTGSYFFYGTLMDPALLAEILDLAEPLKLRPAYIMGYSCMLWGQYPALTDGPMGAIVEGAVYDVRSEDDGDKLASYETKNYEPVSCTIFYADEQEPATANGYTFMYCGNSEDLSKGAFDLKVWLKRMGRGSAVEELEARRIKKQSQ